MTRWTSIAALIALSGLPAGAARADDALDAVVAAARAEGLPVDLLEAKRREAALKGVPTERALPVMERLRDELRQAAALVGDTPASERSAIVRAAARALDAKAQPAQVGALLRELPPGQAARAIESLAALAAAGIAPEEALALVREALRQGRGYSLSTLRPAIQALREAGLPDADAVAEVRDGLKSGRAPMDTAAGTRSDRERSSRTASQPVSGGGEGAVDRDRTSERRSSQGSSGGNGRDNGKGSGKP